MPHEADSVPPDGHPMLESFDLPGPATPELPATTSTIASPTSTSRTPTSSDIGTRTPMRTTHRHPPPSLTAMRAS